MLPLSFYIEIVAAGVLTGLVYGLMALGLSVIFGVIRVVNFAHGEMAVIAMYATFLLVRATGIDPLLAMAPIALGLFIVGWALQTAVINPFIHHAEHEQFMLLVGFSIILVNGSLMVFGPDARHVAVAYSFDSFEIGTVLVDKVRVKRKKANSAPDTTSAASAA